MIRQTVDIRASKLGKALTARLTEKPEPSQTVRVTIEPVPDYSDVPADVLDSQFRGIRERMKPGDRASVEEIDGLFKKWS